LARQLYPTPERSVVPQTVALAVQLLGSLPTLCFGSASQRDRVSGRHFWVRGRL